MKYPLVLFRESSRLNKLLKNLITFIVVENASLLTQVVKWTALSGKTDNVWKTDRCRENHLSLFVGLSLLRLKIPSPGERTL